VNIKFSGHLSVDLAQEGQPLLMPMTRGGVKLQTKLEKSGR
jgi:hypothetical protein